MRGKWWDLLLVREGGVEPPRAFALWILSPARLPVPPLSLAEVSHSCETGYADEEATWPNTWPNSITRPRSAVASLRAASWRSCSLTTPAQPSSTEVQHAADRAPSRSRSRQGGRQWE
jgi:hypothetical protein